MNKDVYITFAYNAIKGIYICVGVFNNRNIASEKASEYIRTQIVDKKDFHVYIIETEMNKKYIVNIFRDIRCNDVHMNVEKD